MITVGERIKRRREELGLSQTDLAKKMGYSGKEAISKTECRGNNITTTKIAKFAKALDCSSSYLLGWEDEADLTEENADFLGSMLYDNIFMDYCKKLKALSLRDRQVVYTLIESLSNR